MSSGFPGKIVVQQQLRGPHQDALAFLVIGVLRLKRGADDLFRRDAIDLLGIDADEVLSAAGNDVGLVAVGAQILHRLQHRLINQVGVRTVPALVLGLRQPVLHDAWNWSTVMPVWVATMMVSRSFMVSFAIAALSPESTA